jgi:hypothetical protein
VARVSVPFTEGRYCGEEERPNMELAHNSLTASRRTSDWKCRSNLYGYTKGESFQISHYRQALIRYFLASLALTKTARNPLFEEIPLHGSASLTRKKTF